MGYVTIELRGRLEPLNTTLNMEKTLPEFNLAAAQGKQFVMLQNRDSGNMVAVNVHNILTIEELEDDAEFLS